MGCSCSRLEVEAHKSHWRRDPIPRDEHYDYPVYLFIDLEQLRIPWNESHKSKLQKDDVVKLANLLLTKIGGSELKTVVVFATERMSKNRNKQFGGLAYRQLMDDLDEDQCIELREFGMKKKNNHDVQRGTDVSLAATMVRTSCMVTAPSIMVLLSGDSDFEDFIYHEAEQNSNHHFVVLSYSKCSSIKFHTPHTENTHYVVLDSWEL
eukprot:GHVH01007088.1.p1 GENE.GHVH01007088.1~~GHVH01007088.1.p1  ORF type:complete len:208 (+),score=26.50 GHVH01007088.1:51-674(+)